MADRRYVGTDELRAFLAQAVDSRGLWRVLDELSGICQDYADKAGAAGNDALVTRWFNRRMSLLAVQLDIANEAPALSGGAYADNS